MSLVVLYLLAGLVVAFLLEHAIRDVGENVNFSERVWLITLWPLATAIFIYHFIKGFLGRD